MFQPMFQSILAYAYLVRITSETIVTMTLVTSNAIGAVAIASTIISTIVTFVFI